MNQTDYLQYHEAFCNDCRIIAKSKSHDYSGVEDIFKNFKAVGNDWIEIGFFTRMMDKMGRLKSFIQQDTLEVNDESIKDTMRDIVNYSILLSAYLEEKNNNED